MLDEIDSFDLVLALDLGMTLEEMQGKMSNREYILWRAYYRYRNSMREFEKQSG